jgi:hypothetical protein
MKLAQEPAFRQTLNDAKAECSAPDPASRQTKRGTIRLRVSPLDCLDGALLTQLLCAAVDGYEFLTKCTD